jgi:hypothetical protein
MNKVAYRFELAQRTASFNSSSTFFIDASLSSVWLLLLKKIPMRNNFFQFKVKSVDPGRRLELFVEDNLAKETALRHLRSDLILFLERISDSNTKLIIQWRTEYRHTFINTLFAVTLLRIICLRTEWRIKSLICR